MKVARVQETDSTYYCGVPSRRIRRGLPGGGGRVVVTILVRLWLKGRGGLLKRNTANAFLVLTVSLVLLGDKRSTHLEENISVGGHMLDHAKAGSRCPSTTLHRRGNVGARRESAKRKKRAGELRNLAGPTVNEEKKL